ncbi:short-chain dehydrogenase/reductase [Paractinoplanes abujensis]|uniref:Short-subunit dehydrogenase n=1 Tax=Paractinoplanes abujensis TaxID=882441 RepID=A0A7W7CQD4_9ACTN|nr:oxidoreductase [Actinoplanes abujensis]MBB4692494.1 short-subunit dehydrogenase [Actinoplanes abujensis]GID24030.1 short-chain dehydrogenase/reductase [Actinoplanes abujensis]
MKTVLVTGASSGMGKAAAVKLLAEGHTVYAVARRVERMRDLEQKGAVVVAVDVTRDEDVVRLVERIEAEHGAVDVLVNNAGFGLYGAVEDITLDEARHQFEVNLFALARLTQLVLPGMRKQRSGTIVNMSSMGGKVYTPLGAWYHATKHAVEGWSDSLRLELAPLGVSVVVIEPGIIDTEFGDVVAGPMLERSGTGAYAELARKVADGTSRSYSRGATPPSVIADVIARAIVARRPRTRYVAGRYARMLITMRKWLGDRVYDRVMMGRL